jgi:hypothetical protein
MRARTVISGVVNSWKVGGVVSLKVLDMAAAKNRSIV